MPKGSPGQPNLKARGPRPHTRRTVLDVFEDKVLIGDDCWQWTGKRSRDHIPYGQFTLTNTGRQLAHRAMYELLVGPIPEGMQLDHLCRNTLCVRPDHLEPVTGAENLRRSYRDNPRQRDPITGRWLKAVK